MSNVSSFLVVGILEFEIIPGKQKDSHTTMKYPGLELLLTVITQFGELKLFISMIASNIRKSLSVSKLVSFPS